MKALLTLGAFVALILGLQYALAALWRALPPLFWLVVGASVLLLTAWLLTVWRYKRGS